MLEHSLSALIGAATTPAQLDELSRQVWEGLALEVLEDVAAERLAQAIQARRSPGRRLEVLAGGKVDAKPVRAVSIFPAKRRQRSPDRQASIERRRALSAPGWFPRHLAVKFTPAELAVLKIIADEVEKRGQCGACHDEIAARAGVSRSTVKRALKTAERELLILVHQRPRPGQKNLPNLIAIVSREWKAWLARGKRIGVQTRTPTETEIFQKLSRESQDKPATPRATGRNENRTPGAVVRLDERRKAR